MTTSRDIGAARHTTMQQAADLMNKYCADLALSMRATWARTERGYVLYEGVTRTHDDAGRLLSKPDATSRVIARNAAGVRDFMSGGGLAGSCEDDNTRWHDSWADWAVQRAR